MNNLQDQPNPPGQLIPDKVLAVIPLAVGGFFLLIVFAVSCVCVLTLLPGGGGGGGGWGGVAVGGGLAFAFNAFLFSLLFLLPLGLFIFRTGLRLWQGVSKARKSAEAIAWILGTCLFLFVWYLFSKLY